MFFDVGNEIAKLIPRVFYPCLEQRDLQPLLHLNRYQGKILNLDSNFDYPSNNTYYL